MAKWMIIPAMLVSLAVLSQGTMRTVVTPGPIATGESFQVQYVLDEIDNSDDFYQPVFKGFRVVSGPQFYTAQSYGPDGPVKMRNIVYTLAALKPGRFMIPGASAKVNGKVVKSRGSFIEIIQGNEQLPDQRQLGDYYLRAGEDPYQKIKKNLFVKVQVDRQSCYVGQPVTAVFKLYSTLESRSDIVKNPGLYGFTVQDMIGLQEGRVATEMINGKKFDVHTIRKVQMYPLRPGTFQVDPMEVRNKVEFYKAAVPGKKQADQTIREGVIETDDFRSLVNTVVYESSMSTEPVTITVKPTPDVARPDSFSGAVGKFRIESSLVKNSIHRNEEAVLEVRVSGQGNFTQMAAPEITWPSGVTAFEPEIKDRLDPASAPLKGDRLFRYHFVSTRTGSYQLPGVVISFFNPDSNRYQTVATAVIPLTVTDSVNRPVLKSDAVKSPAAANWKWIAALTGLAALAAFFIWMFTRKKQKARVEPQVLPVKASRPSVDELLADAAKFTGSGDQVFYATLRQAIWRFFSIHFNISGSQLNRNYLLGVMINAGVSESLRREVSAILDHCEIGMFTTVFSEEDQSAWYHRTEKALLELEQLSGAGKLF